MLSLWDDLNNCTEDIPIVPTEIAAHLLNADNYVKWKKINLDKKMTAITDGSVNLSFKLSKYFLETSIDSVDKIFLNLYVHKVLRRFYEEFYKDNLPTISLTKNPYDVCFNEYFSIVKIVCKFLELPNTYDFTKITVSTQKFSNDYCTLWNNLGEHSVALLGEGRVNLPLNNPNEYFCFCRDLLRIWSNVHMKWIGSKDIVEITSDSMINSLSRKVKT